MSDDRIISEGENWVIEDQLDGIEVMTFNSWDYHNPEERAREAFKVYPRQAKLWYQKVVKYERELIAGKPHPDDALLQGQTIGGVEVTEGMIEEFVAEAEEGYWDRLRREHDERH